MMRLLLIFSLLFFLSCSTKGTGTLSFDVISLYQTEISAIDGERCTMYPSCSHYSKTAFRKYGFFKGFIMTCDRLIRCGGDESKVSPSIVINNKRYVYDPPENN